MKKLITLCIIIGLSSCHVQKEIPSHSATQKSENTIHFTKSDYGLIFTKLIVNNEPVKAMIDFGDPNIVQLSSKFVNQQSLPVTKANGIMMDLNGNEFQINEGIIKNIKVGNLNYENIKFSSSPGEMESVSKQINTEFNAVVGWGYFKQYFFELDYKNQLFNLSKEKFEISKSEYTTAYESDGSYLKMPVSINGNIIYAILDTGSPVSVIDKNYILENKIEKYNSKIGGKPITINYYEEDLSVLSDLNVKAIIGGDIMSQYKIYIDPFQKTINLQ